MNRRESEQPELLSPRRLEALTDGVYAIAMTVMVLNLAVPSNKDVHTEEQLLASLAGLLNQFTDYFVSFLILGVFWVLNNHQGHLVVRTNLAYLWWNLWVLMMVVLLPFNTALQSAFPTLATAETLFHLNLLAAGAGLYLAWKHAVAAGLTDPSLRPEAVRQSTYLALMLPAFSLVGLPLGLLFPDWSILLYLAMPLALIRLRRRWWLAEKGDRADQCAAP